MANDLPDPLPEIHLSNLSWTVGEWVLRDEDGDKDRDDKWVLDAPYQRGSVWDTERRRNLIRSLIMGIPVGSVVYAKIAYGWIPERPKAYARVIDGKQRVEAVRAWYNDEFTVPGWWFSDRRMGPELRSRDVVCSDVPFAAGIRHAQLPALEYDSTYYTVPNPDYDPSVRTGYNGVKPGDPRTQLYLRVPRTNEEALRVEAAIFDLVNFGGVAQTDEDRARAAAAARG